MKKHWKLADMPLQTGKTILITGANDGLGLQLTKAFALKEATTIIMACRNLQKAEEAKEEVHQRYPKVNLDLIELDLGDLKSVKSFAGKVNEKYSSLQVIMCNAGIMAVPYGETKDGLEMQMGINYYGHFALIGHLMPLILKSSGSRIVTTSSVAEKFGRMRLEKPVSAENYSRWMVYGDSKLAMLMLGLMLDEKFKEKGINAKGVSAHPGFARTNLRYTRLETEKNPWQRFQLKFYESISMSGEKGALPLLFAATDPEIKGGEYIGVSGIGEVQGYPKITRGQKRAYDPTLREKLWKKSEEVTGVKFYFKIT